MHGAEPPRVPLGLRDLMKSLTKEVLREKPPDIYEFSAQYFESLMQEKKDYSCHDFEPAISYEAIFRNRERNQVPLSLVYTIIPDGLTELIKEFIKAVLRQNPDNICKFAVAYFRKMQQEQSVETRHMEYTAYENYFKSKERLTFTPYVRCSCGRTFGQGPLHGQYEKYKELSHTSISMRAPALKQTVDFDGQTPSSKPVAYSKETETAVAKSGTSVTGFIEPKPQLIEQSKAGSISYSSKEYIRAIYIIQSFFRRCLKNRKVNIKADNTNAKYVAEALGSMTVQNAALIIQRTLRKLFVERVRKALKSEVALVPKLENIAQNEDGNDNNSEAASYTSASTALLSAGSLGENTENGTGSHEDGIIQNTIMESEEMEAESLLPFTESIKANEPNHEIRKRQAITTNIPSSSAEKSINLNINDETIAATNQREIIRPGSIIHSTASEENTPSDTIKAIEDTPLISSAPKEANIVSIPHKGQRNSSTTENETPSESSNSPAKLYNKNTPTSMETDSDEIGKRENIKKSGTQESDKKPNILEVESQNNAEITVLSDDGIKAPIKSYSLNTASNIKGTEEKALPKIAKNLQEKSDEIETAGKTPLQRVKKESIVDEGIIKDEAVSKSEATNEKIAQLPETVIREVASNERTSPQATNISDRKIENTVILPTDKDQDQNESFISTVGNEVKVTAEVAPIKEFISAGPKSADKENVTILETKSTIAHTVPSGKVQDVAKLELLNNSALSRDEEYLSKIYQTMDHINEDESAPSISRQESKDDNKSTEERGLDEDHVASSSKAKSYQSEMESATTLASEYASSIDKVESENNKFNSEEKVIIDQDLKRKDDNAKDKTNTEGESPKEIAPTYTETENKHQKLITASEDTNDLSTSIASKANENEMSSRYTETNDDESNVQKLSDYHETTQILSDDDKTDANLATKSKDEAIIMQAKFSSGLSPESDDKELANYTICKPDNQLNMPIIGSDSIIMQTSAFLEQESRATKINQENKFPSREDSKEDETLTILKNEDELGEDAELKDNGITIESKSISTTGYIEPTAEIKLPIDEQYIAETDSQNEEALDSLKTELLKKDIKVSVEAAAIQEFVSGTADSKISDQKAFFEETTNKEIEPKLVDDETLSKAEGDNETASLSKSLQTEVVSPHIENEQTVQISKTEPLEESTNEKTHTILGMESPSGRQKVIEAITNKEIDPKIVVKSKAKSAEVVNESVADTPALSARTTSQLIDDISEVQSASDRKSLIEKIAGNEIVPKNVAISVREEIFPKPKTPEVTTEPTSISPTVNHEIALPNRESEELVHISKTEVQSSVDKEFFAEEQTYENIEPKIEVKAITDQIVSKPTEDASTAVSKLHQDKNVLSNREKEETIENFISECQEGSAPSAPVLLIDETVSDKIEPKIEAKSVRDQNISKSKILEVTTKPTSVSKTLEDEMALPESENEDTNEISKAKLLKEETEGKIEDNTETQSPNNMESSVEEITTKEIERNIEAKSIRDQNISKSKILEVTTKPTSVSKTLEDEMALPESENEDTNEIYKAKILKEETEEKIEDNPEARSPINMESSVEEITTKEIEPNIEAKSIRDQNISKPKILEVITKPTSVSKTLEDEMALPESENENTTDISKAMLLKEETEGKIEDNSETQSPYNMEPSVEEITTKEIEPNIEAKSIRDQNISKSKILEVITKPTSVSKTFEDEMALPESENEDANEISKAKILKEEQNNTETQSPNNMESSVEEIRTMEIEPTIEAKSVRDQNISKSEILEVTTKPTSLSKTLEDEMALPESENEDTNEIYKAKILKEETEEKIEDNPEARSPINMESSVEEITTKEIEPNIEAKSIRDQNISKSKILEVITKPTSVSKTFEDEMALPESENEDANEISKAKILKEEQNNTETQSPNNMESSVEEIRTMEIEPTIEAKSVRDQNISKSEILEVTTKPTSLSKTLEDEMALPESENEDTNEIYKAKILKEETEEKIEDNPEARSPINMESSVEEITTKEIEPNIEAKSIRDQNISKSKILEVITKPTSVSKTFEDEMALPESENEDANEISKAKILKEEQNNTETQSPNNMESSVEEIRTMEIEPTIEAKSVRDQNISKSEILEVTTKPTSLSKTLEDEMALPESENEDTNEISKAKILKEETEEKIEDNPEARSPINMESSVEEITTKEIEPNIEAKSIRDQNISKPKILEVITKPTSVSKTLEDEMALPESENENTTDISKAMLLKEETERKIENNPETRSPINMESSVEEKTTKDIEPEVEAILVFDQNATKSQESQPDSIVFISQRENELSVSKEISADESNIYRTSLDSSTPSMRDDETLKIKLCVDDSPNTTDLVIDSAKTESKEDNIPVKIVSITDPIYSGPPKEDDEKSYLRLESPTTSTKHKDDLTMREVKVDEDRSAVILPTPHKTIDYKEPDVVLIEINGSEMHITEATKEPSADRELSPLHAGHAIIDMPTTSYEADETVEKIESKREPVQISSTELEVADTVQIDDSINFESTLDETTSILKEEQEERKKTAVNDALVSDQSKSNPDTTNIVASENQISNISGTDIEHVEAVLSAESTIHQPSIISEVENSGQEVKESSLNTAENITSQSEEISPIAKKESEENRTADQKGSQMPAKQDLNVFEDNLSKDSNEQVKQKLLTENTADNENPAKHNFEKGEESNPTKIFDIKQNVLDHFQETPEHGISTAVKHAEEQQANELTANTATTEDIGNLSTDSLIGTQNLHTSSHEVGSYENPNVSSPSKEQSSLDKEQFKRKIDFIKFPDDPLLAEMHLKSFRLPNALEALPWYDMAGIEEFYSKEAQKRVSNDNLHERDRKAISSETINKEREKSIGLTSKMESSSSSEDTNALGQSGMEKNSNGKQQIEADTKIGNERSATYLYGVAVANQIPTSPRDPQKISTTFTIPFHDNTKKESESQKRDILQEYLQSSDDNQLKTETHGSLVPAMKLKIINRNEFSEPQLELESPTKLFAELNDLEKEVQSEEKDHEIAALDNSKYKISIDTPLEDLYIGDNNEEEDSSYPEESTLQTIIEVNESETPRPEENIDYDNDANIKDGESANGKEISKKEIASVTTAKITSSDDITKIQENIQERNKRSVPESIASVAELETSDISQVEQNLDYDYDFSNEGELIQDTYVKENAHKKAKVNIISGVHNEKIDSTETDKNAFSDDMGKVQENMKNRSKRSVPDNMESLTELERSGSLSGENISHYHNVNNEGELTKDLNAEKVTFSRTKENSKSLIPSAGTDKPNINLSDGIKKVPDNKIESVAEKIENVAKFDKSESHQPEDKISHDPDTNNEEEPIKNANAEEKPSNQTEEDIKSKFLIDVTEFNQKSQSEVLLPEYLENAVELERSESFRPKKNIDNDKDEGEFIEDFNAKEITHNSTEEHTKLAITSEEASSDQTDDYKKDPKNIQDLSKRLVPESIESVTELEGFEISQVGQSIVDNHDLNNKSELYENFDTNKGSLSHIKKEIESKFSNAEITSVETDKAPPLEDTTNKLETKNDQGKGSPLENKESVFELESSESSQPKERILYDSDSGSKESERIEGFVAADETDKIVVLDNITKVQENLLSKGSVPENIESVAELEDSNAKTLEHSKNWDASSHEEVGTSPEEASSDIINNAQIDITTADIIRIDNDETASAANSKISFNILNNEKIIRKSESENKLLGVDIQTESKIHNKVPGFDNFSHLEIASKVFKSPFEESKLSAEKNNNFKQTNNSLDNVNVPDILEKKADEQNAQEETVMADFKEPKSMLNKQLDSNYLKDMNENFPENADNANNRESYKAPQSLINTLNLNIDQNKETERNPDDDEKSMVKAKSNTETAPIVNEIANSENKNIVDVDTLLLEAPSPPEHDPFDPNELSENNASNIEDMINKEQIPLEFEYTETVSKNTDLRASAEKQNSSSPDLPKVSKLAEENMAAKVIQTAYRTYQNKMQKTEVTPSRDHSWSDSQITAIHVEDNGTTTRSGESLKSVASLELGTESYNDTESPIMSQYKADREDPDAPVQGALLEVHETLVKPKLNWYVGNEPIATTKEHEEQAELLDTNVDTDSTSSSATELDSKSSSLDDLYESSFSQIPSAPQLSPQGNTVVASSSSLLNPSSILNASDEIVSAVESDEIVELKGLKNTLSEEPLTQLIADNAGTSDRIHSEGISTTGIAANIDESEDAIERNSTGSSVKNIVAEDESKPKESSSICLSDVDFLRDTKPPDAPQSEDSMLENLATQSGKDLSVKDIKLGNVISDFLEGERSYSALQLTNRSILPESFDNERSAIDTENEELHQIATDFLNSYKESDIPYEQLEEACIKKSVSLTHLEQLDSATIPAETEVQSDGTDAESSQEDSLQTMTAKLRETDEFIERMQRRHLSEVKSNSLDGRAQKGASFEEPTIAPLQQPYEDNAADVEDDAVIVLNRMQREDTRESSAQSDAVVYGPEAALAEDNGLDWEETTMVKISLQRLYTIAGDDTSTIYKSVTIDETIKYIEASENDGEETTATSSSSFCLDEHTSETIREKMMAYSLSEADSDNYDTTSNTGVVAVNVDNAKLQRNDFNVSTALLVDNNDSSTESDSTIVSAATKIQAGARGFLTRRRLRRISDGTKSSVRDGSRASFGNEAISESLEKLIEDTAARKIQTAYRKHYRQRRVKPRLRAASSVDSSLAARRQTLQRGDALHNDSTPEEENSKRGEGRSRSNGAEAVPHDVGVGSRKATANTSTSSASSSIFASAPSSDRSKRIIDNKMKWFAMRQNSMPVQIDSEVFRVIPKHMRKRIKSADGDKKTRRRILKD